MSTTYAKALNKSLIRICIASAAMFPVALYAAGFAIIEHSAKGQGNAFAGGGAVAEDASTMFFNPASMTRLATQVQSAGHIISPKFDFSDRSSTQSTNAGTIPLLATASPNDDGGVVALVPNLYYVNNVIENKLWIGLSVNAPFGLATEYDRNWKGRYHAVDSEIKTINVNPSVAYKFNDWLSLGAGVSAQYIDARLTSAIDFVAVCAGNAGALAATCTGIGSGPGQGANDGSTENNADDISFGFNAGILLEPREGTRLSVAYRSQIKHKLDGKAKFSLPASISTNPVVQATVAGAFADTGITVNADLPEQFSISGFHRFHEQWAVMADATWTGWSSIPELRIVYDNPQTTGDGVAVENLQWDDTWRLSVGFQHYYNPRVTVRAGFAWDQSPVHDPALRTPRLPDNDRYWFSVGSSFELLPHNKLSLDVGYSHLIIPTTRIDRTNDTNARLIGEYESNAHILSAQVSYRFD